MKKLEAGNLEVQLERAHTCEWWVVERGLTTGRKVLTEPGTAVAVVAVKRAEDKTVVVDAVVEGQLLRTYMANLRGWRYAFEVVREG